MVKALNSEWVPNDKHSGAWVKVLIARLSLTMLL